MSAPDLSRSRPSSSTWTVEEVARGKPAADVYLEAARRVGVEPARHAAAEDSASGIRAAGMRVLAYPNRHDAPSAEALGPATRTSDHWPSDVYPTPTAPAGT